MDRQSSTHAAIAHSSNVTTTSLSSLTLNRTDPVTRRLVEGLQCDLDIYNSFIESDEGQDIFIMATMCESRIVYMKNKRAGWYGPVDQDDLFTVMCSDECLQSDELHKKALSLSRCTEVFLIAVDDLALGSKATELGLPDDKSSLYCKLQLEVTHAETQPRGQDADWFVWKLRRAADYRARGNEAFKQEKYGAAVKLYKRALAWLEPPNDRSDVTLDTKIQYSAEELQQVNPVATACYANLAMCYSKLDGDGDVGRCIAAATSALKLEDGHAKARYRRSQAYVTSKEFDLALADLTKLRDLEPDNKLFRSALSRAQTAKMQFRKKQQSAFANIFEK
ncbi:hypothetical protein BBJ29_000838 [Phytophthora kernoviae]|uniref:peptidylprolyl isomerase n=1 Tax=Phytophthora kernoviae TaxID=325452 RepID=A0A3F2S3N4_9STRA|nr:hypothetical protein BBJ29_000838 [Phytophthora kernoviae]RLN69115.1 hypothetical protein BBP00_00000554 [Phytophthora kernoviae]